jgi:hypothetical protein
MAVNLDDDDRRLRIRLLNVACRTIHIVAFAALLGGHLWGVEPDRLRAPLWGTAVSGVALVAVEVVADRRWLLEVRGAMVLLKLGLLLLVPIAWEHRVALLVAVAVVAAVGSHLPGRFRHASVIGALRARTCPRAGSRWEAHGRGSP